MAPLEASSRLLVPSARSACPRVPPRAAARHDAHVDGGDGRVPFHRPRLRWSDGGAPTRPRTDPSRSRPHSRAVSPGPPVRSRAGCGPESPRAQGQRVVLQEGCTAPVRLVRCGAVCGRSLFWASAALRGDSKAPIAPNTWSSPDGATRPGDVPRGCLRALCRALPRTLPAACRPDPAPLAPGWEQYQTGGAAMLPGCSAVGGCG